MAQLKKEEVLNMSFRQFLEKHKPYFTQFTRLRNSGLCWDEYDYTVAKVCRLSKTNLMSFRYVGKLCIKEIEAALSLYDIHLYTGDKTSKEIKAEIKEQLMCKLTPVLEEFVDKVLRITINELTAK